MADGSLTSGHGDGSEFCIACDRRGTSSTARYDSMPRIDQKSCIKCVAMAGYHFNNYPNKIEGDTITTDLDALRERIDQLGPEILWVISTASCFAPRICDRLIEIGDLLEGFGIRIVNNAYGLQSGQALFQLTRP